MLERYEKYNYCKNGTSKLLHSKPHQNKVLTFRKTTATLKQETTEKPATQNHHKNKKTFELSLLFSIYSIYTCHQRRLLEKTAESRQKTAKTLKIKPKNEEEEEKKNQLHRR